MEAPTDSKPLIELRNRVVVTIAIMSGIEPVSVVATRKSMGAGRPSRLRVAFLFEPSVELSRILQNASPARVEYLDRYARSLEHFRELYNRAATTAPR